MGNLKDKRISIYISEDVEDIIKKAASERSMTVSSFVVMAVQDYINNKDVYNFFLKNLKNISI